MDYKKDYIQSTYQLEYLEREGANTERIVLLLHGYSQNATFMMKQFAGIIPPNSHIFAVNGPFPLPTNFPLSKARDKKTPLLQKFAWYFFDAVNQTFPIDYEIPAKLLGQFLNEKNQNNLPITIIGYSQGGYLSLFLNQYCKKIDHVIGVNCSWRYDKLTKPLEICVDSINGDCDVVVDPKMAKLKHQKLIDSGARGEFHSLKNEGHKLTPSIITKVNEIFKKSRPHSLDFS